MSLVACARAPHTRSSFLLLAFFLLLFPALSLSLLCFSEWVADSDDSFEPAVPFYFVTLSAAILFIIVFVTFAYTGTWDFGKERPEFANLQAGMTMQFSDRVMLNGDELKR